MHSSANGSSGQNGNGQTITRRINRVVITGLGALSPVGNSTHALWEGLRAGQSGIGPISCFDASQMRTQLGAELRDFDPRDHMDRKEARRTDPFIQYALVSAKEALEDSGINMAVEVPHRVGVIVASAMGGVKTTIENEDLIQKKGLSRVSPFMIPNMLVDSAAGKIAIEYGMHGPNFSVVSACAAGSAAVGEAFEVIRRGDADVMLTGGSEAPFVSTIFAGFDSVGAMSRSNDEGARACRPFDAERDGFIMGEGCGMLVLENEEHARARGAQIYAELIGYGSSADAHHMVAPHEEGRGAVQAMRMALKKAAAFGISAEDIDYINAHGTSTQFNDKGETHAIKEVLGEHAYNVAVSSTKSMTGHLLGAAGALEAVICAKTIQEGVIMPTINLKNADGECDLNYTPHQPQKADVNVVLSNSFGFGGHNACIMFKKYVQEI